MFRNSQGELWAGLAWYCQGRCQWEDGQTSWALRMGSLGYTSQFAKDFTFTFHFHALEKEMATHSSILAWRISGTGKSGGLLSLRSHRVGHDWSDLAAAADVKDKNQNYCWIRFCQCQHSTVPQLRTSNTLLPTALFKRCPETRMGLLTGLR